MSPTASRLLLTACLISLAAPAFSCGPITHATVADRIAFYVDPQNPPGYRDFLTRHHGPHDTGSIATDAFFAFGDEIGHAAHSREYLDAFRDLLLAELDLPLDDEEERKIAFYLGLLTHHVADWHWHGKGGEPDAFVWEAMAMDAALEETVELGVDVYMLWEQGERNEPADWWYSGQLMVDALHAIGHTSVSLPDLELAMAALETGYSVERLTGYLSYLLWTSNLPWTHQNHATYRPGGLVECVRYGVADTRLEIGVLVQGLLEAP